MNAQAKLAPGNSVYTKIAAVQGALAKQGISKDSENTFDRYKFRGIDAVYNALSPLLAEHGLCILPRMLERDCQERQSRKGEPLFYVTVTAEFDFVSTEDGSTHTVRTYGEAMDRGDKGTNKAMSAAYKYAAFMAFAIPTEGDNDADASSHDVAPRTAGGHIQEEAVNPRQPRIKLDGPYTSKTALWTAFKAFDRELRGCGDLGEFEALMATDDAKALIAQCERDAPQLLTGGEEMPPEFLPLNDLVAQRRKDFTDLETAQTMAGYART
jgi:hypothetical protein